MARMCLVCALLLKKCLAVCLTLCLASDARRRGRGGSGCEICGRSGCGLLCVGQCPPGAFPSQGRVQRVPAYLLVRGRSGRGCGGYCSRRGLRLTSSAGRCSVWLLLGVWLWSCWWCSPCLICG